jgi:hypothetical protein
MAVGGIRAPMDDGLADSDYCYERYTRLAGPLAQCSRDKPYRVRYRSIHHSTREWLATRLIGPQADNLLYGIGTPVTLQKQTCRISSEAA